jgi:4-hydroxy-tetrahydrodipicolinate reductase
VLDFTRPEASLTIVGRCASAGVPIVIGTTGFNATQLGQIRKMAAKTATVLAPNTSVGINVLTSLVEQVAGILGDAYDVEIIEAHHRFKRDAPSGTALALGEAAAKTLKRDLDRVAVSGRKGTGARQKSEIGMLSLRAGDIAGEHTVLFGGIGERIELTHRAHSRDAFGRGALRAAQWLVGRKKGLYTMRDVLGWASKG